MLVGTLADDTVEDAVDVVGIAGVGVVEGVVDACAYGAVEGDAVTVDGDDGHGSFIETDG